MNRAPAAASPIRHDLVDAADCPLLASAWAMDPGPSETWRRIKRIVRRLLGDGEPVAQNMCLALACVSSGYGLSWCAFVDPRQVS